MRSQSSGAIGICHMSFSTLVILDCLAITSRARSSKSVVFHRSIPAICYSMENPAAIKKQKVELNITSQRCTFELFIYSTKQVI